MTEDPLATRARAAYLASAAGIDRPTRRALAVARRRALASSRAPQAESPDWWPLGAAATAVMLAAMLWASPQPESPVYQASLDEAGLQELMALGQELGIGDEEPELYAWLKH